MSYKIKTGLILAAGKGTRMGQYNGHSKPMVLVANKPLIGYSIEAMLFCGVSTIYVLFSDDSKDLVTLQDRYKRENIFFIYQKNVTGSLSSLSFSFSVVEPPFIMTDADIIIQPNILKQALDNYVYQGEDMAIAAISAPVFPNKKTLHIRDGRPIGFDGKGYTCPDTKGDIFCQGGMIYLWFRSPRSELVEFEQNGIRRMSVFLNDYLKKHQVSVLTVQNVWDVDTPEDIRSTVKILRDAFIPE